MARIEIPASPVKAQVDPALKRFFDVEATVSTRPLATRGDEAKTVEVEVANDDILEVEYFNGIRLWLRADDYEKSREFLPTSAARGMAKEWIAKTVHRFTLNPLDAAGRLAGVAGALAVVRHFEEKLDPAPGLYHVTDVFTQNEQILSSSGLKGSDKTLVFLHGTASNTSGSFKALSIASGQTELSIVRNTTPEWRKLRDEYRERILSFEHRTLSQNPVDNAFELASLLPDSSTLHLVSHSRGGLVGELLCLNQELTDDYLKGFRDRGRDEEARKLKELASLVVTKRFNIERFVRVACPARGTVLASKRLDVYLSFILHLAGLIPGFAANPFFEFFKAASIQLIKSRTQPEKVPGIEAMMPESPLVQLLNLRGLESKANLAVIAGDQKGDSLLTQLRDAVTDFYYWENHDLIVNTDSMYRGVKRTGLARYFFDRGPNVNHFQYFANHRTRDLLVNWLTFDKDKLNESGFKELTDANLKLEEVSSRGTLPPDAPVLIFIPGFMGTHLADNHGRVWLDFDALALGGAERLKDLNKPLELLGPPYQAIISFLESSFHVTRFEYDWTKSTVVNGANLANLIEVELERQDRPVHLLSHSSGSLIVRAVTDTVWTTLTSRGCHWVQLGGVPNGTYSAVAMVTGEAAIVRELQLLHYAPGDQIRDVFAAWPGLLELLPPEFLSPDKWLGFVKTPDSELLREAAEARQKLAHYESFYVAGSSAGTPIVLNGKLSLSNAGDGRVLQKDLPKNNIWYIDVAHGDLASHAPSFPGILDLLLKGGTDQLQRKASSPRIGEPKPDGPILFPDESGLIDAALGGTSTQVSAADISVIKVSVLHGDISKSAHPVLVGHYLSDSIVSAERRIDNLLNGVLTRRFLMGVYPGELGTSEVVRINGNHPSGAIVVGLGQVGKLTEERLRATVMQAILRYALTLAEDPQTADGVWRSAAFSAILIGTYGGETIGVLASVSSVVRAALKANRVLRERKLWDRVRIDGVEFIEIYEDLATQAIHAINRINDRLRLDLNDDERVEPMSFINVAEGSRDKRPPDQYSAGWWRRIEIMSETNSASEFTLRFNILTDRARSEESTTGTQTRRVQSFVKKLINYPDFNGRTAVTLYELLVPKRIKQQSNDSANLILEVDKDSAQFPWELMSRRSGSSVLPFATNAGLIRQFKTSVFEEPRATRENSALVAAFPHVANFPELKGAADEATEIHGQLRAAGYVVDPTNPIAVGDGDEVIAALFSGDYRILHLAGHGVVDPKNKTGLVLGDGDIFTAADVRNLPSTPDLVFLNCCHVGRIDPLVNQLAVSLSQAFIEIGCRAVVAAGWAVNDSAAVTFAREFYGQFLTGETFGNSVLEARKLVRRDYAETNTWGAYQCYGNPDFRLKLAGGVDTLSPTPRTRGEFMESCRNLMQDNLSKTAGLDAVNALLRDVPAGWLDGQVRCTFGDAFAHYGDFKTAVDFYRKAITDSGAEAPIAAVQRLANLLDRHAKTLNQQAAEAQNQADKEDLESQAAKQISEAIGHLNWLRTLGETTDRWSMLGGAYRRMALFKTRNSNLGKACECYSKGHHLALEEKGQINPYPALNWLSLRFLLGEKAADLEADLQKTMKAAADQSRSQTDFWSQIGYPDSLLTGGMIRGTLSQEKAEITKVYEILLREQKNQVRVDSVYGGISDLRDLVPDSALRDDLSDIADSIKNIRTTV
jgi:CHAT domain